VAVGGTAGQVLQKLSGVSYDTGWLTLPADYITSVTAPLAVTAGDLTVDLSAYLPVSGGALDVNGTITASTATVNSLFAGDTFGVELSANPSENASLQYNGVQVQNAIGSMLVTASGLTFPNLSTQSIAFPGFNNAALTGNPTAPTPATSDNDTSIATTAYVKAQAFGDRYLSSSTTSNTISNGNKTFTIGTGLSYTPTQSITIAYDAANHMHGEVLTYNSGTGVLTVDINHHTGSGTYTAWTVNVAGVVPVTSVAFADITGAVSGNANLQAALDLKANLASPALTGNVTITTNSAGAALFIEQAGAGNILTLHDQATDTNFVAIDANGKINTVIADATTAGLNVPHTATAPTSPVNGDIWTTTGGVFARINAGTTQLMNLGSTQTVSGSITFSNASQTLGNSTATGTINVASGATISASTKTVNVGTGGVSGSTTLTTVGPVLGASTTTIGGTTAASTLNLATGATLTATTKAVNIGTAGVAGSTTNIAIGSTTGTSTTTLQGNVTASGLTLDLGNSTATSASYTIGGGATISGATKTVNIGTNGAAGSTTTVNIGSTLNTTNVNFSVTNGTISLGGNATASTPGVDTNTTALATTAYVVGQAGSATPLVDGTAAVGTSLRYARQDHVHGTDTTRAPLASPSLTGVPLSTTAAVDTNTTQIATTAYVIGQGYAKLASPTFTGTPTLPTGTIGTTQSPGNNTTALATTAFVTAAVPAFATEAQLLAGTSTTTAINPSLLRTAMSNAGYTTYSSLIGNYSSYQTGTAGISIYSDYVSPYVNVANGKMGFSPSSALNVNSMQGRGTSELIMNWTKPMWFSYRFHYGAAIGSDANTICRVTIGKTASTFGDLSSRGIGIKWDGSTTGLFTVMAHNGTTLSTVASSVSVSSTTYFPTNTSSADFLVYSDGAGNVTLFCNNVQIATTTGGPSSGSGAARFIFETDNTTSTTGMCAPTYMGIRSHFAY
jgi:hypothetical protein